MVDLSPVSPTLPVPFQCEPTVPKKRVGVAIALGIILPGIGQVYTERVFRGIVVILLTLITLSLQLWFIPWICGVFDAYSLAKAWNREIDRDPYRRPW